jgi:DNA gyrase subunit A
MSEQKNLSVIPVAINDEMKKSYLEYAMSVIVSRAIPDVRDGLKPVHRRILYSMHEIGCDFNKAYKKSARIVGDVMGKYHPHGDSAIYDALVRLAQDFSMSVKLIDGQGNFGSIDGDPAAAMRYTEARLSKISHTFLEDLEKQTVEFRQNYDGSEKEPSVLPAAFPNILVNGGSGIAVGMATNIPTHNITEVLNAAIAYLDNPEITAEELAEIVPAPDFPTAGYILNKQIAQKAIICGRGSVPVRGKAHFEELKTKDLIVITEIPYQVIKARLIEKIIELQKEKIIEGISGIRDESNKQGIRIVIEVSKKDGSKEVILNQIYKHSPLQSSVSYNMTVLDKQVPVLMGLKDIITKFIEFKQEIVKNRTIFLVNQAREKAHLMIGLHVAVDNIDKIVDLIRNAENTDDAKQKLLSIRWNATESVLRTLELIQDNENKISNGNEFNFTERQVKAILDMRLGKLTGLERDKIASEISSLCNEIEGFLQILSSRETIKAVAREELVAIRDLNIEPRKTEILNESVYGDFDELDFIEPEDVLVVKTVNGFIKRVPLDSYNIQNRGGQGKNAIETEDGDFVSDIFVSNTHNPILLFTNTGRVYKIMTYKIPEFKTITAKGRAIVNLVNFAEGETVTNCISLNSNLSEDAYLMFATKKGNIRKSSISDFERIQSNGKIAIGLEEDDALIDVRLTYNPRHILLSTKLGHSIRFKVEDLRIVKSRSSDGVRGIKLSEKDEVVSMQEINGSEIDMEIRDTYLSLPVQSRTIAKENENIIEVGMLISDAFKKVSEERERNIFMPNDEVIKLAKEEEFIFTVTANGFGKITSAYEYRITNRGGKGITNANLVEGNYVVSVMNVNRKDEVMLCSKNGKIIRISLEKISVIGRNTKGVKLFNLSDDTVASVTKGM